jgi:hypothetical protein
LLIHQHGDPALLDDVVAFLLLVEGEPVLEPRAAAPLDEDPQGLFSESGIVLAKYFTFSMAASVSVRSGPASVIGVACWIPWSWTSRSLLTWDT